jgi:hypothetical protein
MNLQKEIEVLFASQQQDWEQLRNAVEQMKSIRRKSFRWGSDFAVNVELNPARLRSATAKREKAEIEKRPCFLCETNRPKVQKGIPFLEKYIILCNPFPILQQHVTIALHSHVPQRIRRKMDDMLRLVESLPNHIVFYNGAKSGASAPDHFHFQAGMKQPALLQGDNELRSCMAIESESKEEAVEFFEEVYRYLSHHQPDEDEPMMNVVAFMEKGKYRIHIFPRKTARPKQYYAEGAKKLLVTPGALDMAGLFTVVREEDFEKITQQDIEDIYAQVSRQII